jgi:hypothetical protein
MAVRILLIGRVEITESAGVNFQMAAYVAREVHRMD